MELGIVCALARRVSATLSWWANPSPLGLLRRIKAGADVRPRRRHPNASPMRAGFKPNGDVPRLPEGWTWSGVEEAGEVQLGQAVRERLSITPALICDRIYVWLTCLKIVSICLTSNP
jgi:hypothetical protein